MSIKPAISQIASISGVSITAVSRFINSTVIVKGSTIKKVMGTIHSLDYPLPESFIAISTKKDSKVVLISIPPVSSPFYNDVIKGAQDAALRHDYYTPVNIQHPNSSIESTFLNLLNNIDLCGAIILNAMDQRYFNSFYHTIPSVQCYEYTENQNPVSYTSIDDATAVKTMMEHILFAGHTKIAFLCGPGQYKHARQRKVGYLQTLEAAHIPLNKDWIIQLPELDFNMALSSTYQPMSQKKHPTAVFIVSDVLAVAVVRGCRLVGLSVPADIIVTGFDNVNISQATSPPITTINQSEYQAGYITCELLIGKLNTPGAKPWQVLLNTELIMWGSIQRQRTQHQNITDREAYSRVK